MWGRFCLLQSQLFAILFIIEEQQIILQQRMISKLFEQTKVNKTDRKKFIPFVNERDFMGSLLSDNMRNTDSRSLGSSNTKNIAMIENLKKSTKEYFFDKKYNKLVDKLRRMEESTHKKDYDYDRQIDRCFQTLNYTNTFYEKQHEEQTYYVDLKQELNQKISFLKTDILGKIQGTRQAKRRKRFRTLNLSEEFDEKELIRTTINKENNQSSDEPRINKEIFKSLSKKSRYMADFTNEGLKYKNLVENRKLNPWKKWYIKQEIELFPGQKITVKKLQKSIY